MRRIYGKKKKVLFIFEKQKLQNNSEEKFSVHEGALVNV